MPLLERLVGEGLRYFTLTDEELKGYTIIHAGIPDPNDPNMVTAPTEPISELTELQPVDVVIFYEPKSQYPVDESGCNQWAFVVDQQKALYVRGRVRSIKLSRLRKLKTAIVNCQVSTTVAGTTVQSTCGKNVAPGVGEAVLCTHTADKGKFVKVVGGSGDCTDPTPKEPSDAEKAAEKAAEDAEVEKLMNQPMPKPSAASKADEEELKNSWTIRPNCRTTSASN